MATKTTVNDPIAEAALDPEIMDPAVLENLYRVLSLRVSEGDVSKATFAQLDAVEGRLDLIQRTARRAAAAAQETERIAAETEREAARAERQAQEAAYQSAIACRTDAYSTVEDLTDELVLAVQAALVAGNAAHSCALQIGAHPGITASSRISTFLAWRLGRDGGEEVAGLSDQVPVSPGLRVPLVQPVNKES